MEIYELFDYTLPPRLTEYINYMLTVKNMSMETIKNYKSEIKMFLRFIKKLRTRSKDKIELIDISDIDDEFIKRITLNEMYAFMSYVTIERKNGAYARARKISALKSFFKYLESKAKVITQNPARELESPKIDKRNPIYLTFEESKRLLNNISGNHKERNYCIIMLFLNCGLRLSELVGINISNIKEDTLTVIGKGNKERTVYLNESCLEAINDYLEVRVEPDDEEDKDALFVSGKRKRISKKAVQSFLKKYLVEAELTGKKYTVHKLRHTSATLLYKHGKVDIRVLQQILGHKSVATTQIYTHVDEEQLREAVKSNPLADFTKK